MLPKIRSGYFEAAGLLPPKILPHLPNPAEQKA
jgi:hypothetical protein